MKTVSDNKSGINDANGFTLLEVLFSVAIIALVFVSLLRMQTAAISLASATRFVSVSPALARQILTEVDADLEGFTKTQGNFDQTHPGYQWTCDISEVDSDFFSFLSEENQDKLKRIEITITGPSDQAPYQLVTWRTTLEPL